jgi:hypothetical protein
VLSNIIAKIKGRKLYVESQSSKFISHISYSIGVIIWMKEIGPRG